MAISYNPTTCVITIPKADTVYVETNSETGYEVRSYDEYALMREIADYLDSEAGITCPPAFIHKTETTLSGVTYVHMVEFVSPYTFTFENGTYQVVLNGGTNTNFLDVLNPNSVSVIPSNSAGKQSVSSGSGLSTEEHDHLLGIPDTTMETDERTKLLGLPEESEIATAVWAAALAQQLLTDVVFLKDIEGGQWEIVNDQMIFYKADNVTEVARFNLFDNTGTAAEESVVKRVRV